MQTQGDSFGPKVVSDDKKSRIFKNNTNLRELILDPAECEVSTHNSRNKKVVHVANIRILFFHRRGPLEVKKSRSESALNPQGKINRGVQERVILYTFCNFTLTIQCKPRATPLDPK